MLSSVLSTSELIQTHRAQYLPIDKVRVIVRRKHVLQDTLHQLRCGLDTSRVTFVGEPAIDTGGPMREYLNILMSSVARNNTLFSGEDSCRVPTQNLIELEKKTFFHIGAIFALSLVHGGSSPQFLAPSVANYIVHGCDSVQVSVEDIPSKEMKDKVLKVIIIIFTSHSMYDYIISGA